MAKHSRIVALFVITILILAIVPAQKVDIETSDEELLAHYDWNHPEVMEAARERARLERELNAVYDIMMKFFADNSWERENLKTAQLAWIAYRDAAAQSEMFAYHGGNPSIRANYEIIANLTSERTNRLIKMLQGVAEADRPKHQSSAREALAEVKKMQALEVQGKKDWEQKVKQAEHDMWKARHEQSG